jgi:hypothetical protein
LDNTVKTESDIEKKIGIPVIGTISHITEGDLLTNNQYQNTTQRRTVRRDYNGQKKKTV